MQMISTIFEYRGAWLIGGLALMTLELLVPGVFLWWVGIGALMTGMALNAFPDMALQSQLLTFSLTMAISVVIGIEYQDRVARGDGAKINAGLDQYAGHNATALTDFAAEGGFIGRISFQDTSYSAKSKKPIQSGDAVIIVTHQAGLFEVAKESDCITMTLPSNPREAEQPGNTSTAKE